MLVPRRVKHRKQHHPDRSALRPRAERRSRSVTTASSRWSRRTSQSGRSSPRVSAMTRHIRRGGKVWISIYPDRPITRKPAETRMGSGKGSPEWWIANVKPGRVMFELSGVPEDVAREAMRRAMHKLPMKCRFVHGVRRGGVMAVGSKDPAGAEAARRWRTTSWSTSCGRPRRTSTCASRPRPGSWRTTADSARCARTSPRIYTTMRERHELGIVTTESETAGDNSQSDITQPARGFRKSRKASSSATRWTRPLSSPSRTE